MRRGQKGYQVTKAYTFDDIWALGPCWSEGRVRAAIDAAGGAVTATQIAQADICIDDRRWVLTRLLAKQDRSALIAWVWRCLARIDRDCPEWRTMLAAPGDVSKARAASDAATRVADYDAADAAYYAANVVDDVSYANAVRSAASAAHAAADNRYDDVVASVADLAATLEAL